MTWLRIVAVGMLVALGTGCSVIGPSCLGRQKRGTVTTLNGEVAAGAIAMHRVAYGVDGSQNDVRLTWDGQFTSGGPRIQVYATKVACSAFSPPPAANEGPCVPLGAAGWIDGHDVGALVVTHGRGNPEVLGAPPEFTLWVVGDARQVTAYTLDVSWFVGPDC